MQKLININVYLQEFACISFHEIQYSRSFCLLQQKPVKSILIKTNQNHNKMMQLHHICSLCIWIFTTFANNLTNSITLVTD